MTVGQVPLSRSNSQLEATARIGEDDDRVDRIALDPLRQFRVIIKAGRPRYGDLSCRKREKRLGRSVDRAVVLSVL